MNAPIPVAVLAGERPGGSALAQHFEQPSSVLVELAGATPLEWALTAIQESERVAGGWLLGPAPGLLQAHPRAARCAAAAHLEWQAPASGPAASLLQLRRSHAQGPLLVTTADHALLTAEIIDFFVDASSRSSADLSVGLVPYPLVAQRWPESRRTRLQFADGPYCGANLFYLSGAQADGAVTLWQTFEAQRKHPWQLARRLGLATLLRYLCRRLSRNAAAARFSALSGCEVAFIELPFARAAVDVDSLADWQLAQHELVSA